MAAISIHPVRVALTGLQLPLRRLPVIQEGMDPAATSTSAADASEQTAGHDAAAAREAGRLARFAAGDDRAFSELVAEYQPMAVAVAERVVGARSEVIEDVVQEAFIRVLRHRGRYDTDRSFRAWLLSIVRNLAIDALRRRRPHGSAEVTALLADPVTGDVGGDMDRAELRVRVAEILGALPKKYRVLLIMREMEGRPAETIADELGLDYGTTRWRLHQARNLFRVAWTRRFGEAQ